jgi:hypothetical protein
MSFKTDIVCFIWINPCLLLPEERRFGRTRTFISYVFYLVFTGFPSDISWKRLRSHRRFEVRLQFRDDWRKNWKPLAFPSKSIKSCHLAVVLVLSISMEKYSIAFHLNVQGGFQISCANEAAATIAPKSFIWKHALLSNTDISQLFSSNQTSKVHYRNF